MKTYIDPTVVLVSTKIDDIVIDRLDPKTKTGESVNGDADPFRLPFLLDTRPPSEFYYDAAKNKLMTLRLGEDDGAQVSFNVPGDHLGGCDNEGVHGQQSQLLRLACWVDMESRTTVSRRLVSHRVLTHASGWMRRSSSIIPTAQTCCCVSAWR